MPLRPHAQQIHRNFPALLAASACLPACLAGLAQAAGLTLHSPNRQIEVHVDANPAGGDLYSVAWRGRPIIHPSPLGLAGVPGSSPTNDPQHLATAEIRTVRETWKPVWGKRSVVNDCYVQAVWRCDPRHPEQPAYRTTLRVYDDGVAFRFSWPDGSRAASASASDGSEFHFAGDFVTWGYRGENHNYGPEPLSSIRERRPPVIVLQAAPDAYLALHEADLSVGDPLQLDKAGPTSLRAVAAFHHESIHPSTPWRVILLGESPGALVDSHLLELLNPPPTDDFSWVKPGLAVWDWRIDGATIGNFRYGMNYPSWVRMVDFAAKHQIPYLVLDANWYGPEFERDSHPLHGDKSADVQKIIRYAAGKNVRIWLYLNDVAGRNHPLAETLAQYAQWGAAGVKYGFMKGTPAEKNQLTREITETCAKFKLLCNFHDGPVHPYGQLRTWPNAVTREYGWAQLDAKKVFGPNTFVTSALVNLVAGPMDMNNGMFDLRQGPTDRVDNPLPVPATLCAEAARTLIIFSGVTILPDIPECYEAHPELFRFITAQQQPWAESKTLAAAIGEFVVTARKSAQGEWLVGAATNEQARKLQIPLDFLDDSAWAATIIQDGDDAHYLHRRESCKVTHQQVRRGQSIDLALAPGGGACIRLQPLRTGNATPAGSGNPTPQAH